MSKQEADIQAISEAVLGKNKYQAIQPDLVARLAEREIAKGRRQKEAVKEVSGKLHQIGAAYFKLTPQYEEWKAELQNLPRDPQHEDVRAFCLRVMGAHNSTAERLPILQDFYRQTLASIGQIDAIFDLACGLNPLALPWLPLSANAHYYGCDIFSDLIAFNNAFLSHFGLQAHLESADIFNYAFWQPVKLALLLKSLPCLEQLEKGSGGKLLEAIPAEYLLVSYPRRSLGGRSKGMLKTYSAQFETLTKEKKWEVSRFEFSSELAFLVRK
jgi:16S rRNA (guanine(1405)-N(7))-methyltransferase